METIGILTAGGYDGKIGGNMAHFERLGRIASQFGRGMALFNLNKNGGITSYTWSNRRNAYKPRPHQTLSPVLYNRIPSRQLERSKAIQSRMDTWEQQGHVITNPHFLTKWELARVWKDDEKVRQYLLDTERLADKQNLAHWLEERSTFYLKPSSGKAGIGMMHVKKGHSGFHLREQQKGRLLDYGELTFREFDQLLQRHQRYGRYLLQEEARVAKWDDRRFDVRMILHRLPESEFSVSGMAVRSAPQYSVTTHVPNGGSRAPLRVVLQEVFGNRQEVVESELIKVGVAAANAIARTPGTWTELSLDASVTPEGRPILFEANAKPMKFDEADIELYGKRKLFESLSIIAKNMENSHEL